MTKLFAVTIAVLAFAFFLATAHAENAPAAPGTVSPTPTNVAPGATGAGGTATAANTASAPGSKMKTCAGQYHQQNIPKNQYHAFMSSCMKGQPYTPSVASTLPKPTASVATTTAPAGSKQ